MPVNKFKIQAFLLFTANFLNYAGYYLFLVILSNLGLMAFSRGLTIPLRILILGCLFCIILLNKKFYITPGTRLFLIFAGIYIARIIAEILRASVYHIDTSEILLYFLAICVIPLLILSGLKLRQYDYNVMLWSIVISCLLLSVCTLVFYRSLIGTVGRISEAATEGESFISPLALSYCGTLAIGVGIGYWMENKMGWWSKAVILASILVSLVPFYLGSSRGAIFSLFVPFIIMFLCKKSSPGSVRLLLIMLITVFVGIYLGEMFGSNIIDRFKNIGSDISEGNSSAIRLDMWKAGMQQFLDNPIFGNSLEADKFQIYPHNMIIEVLLSTGIIGFIPFVMLITNGFKRAIYIFKNDPKNGWISIVFIQSFIQNMFSGSLYGSNWIWFSLGLLYSFDFIRERQKSAGYKNKLKTMTGTLLTNVN